jgi:glucosamine--fructose-6-phosphate aminotransferase (isomerizing)
VGAAGFLTGALRRLEYRGYDSAGIAVTGIRRDELFLVRSVGRVATLQDRIAAVDPSPESGIGIGHTRWATHGGVSETNAHPHRDCAGAIAVVHNGIIDNADELRAELQRAGHAFRSEVDTEVIAHLVEEHRAGKGSLRSATIAAIRRLRGSWGIAVTEASSDEVVLASHQSPLVVGSAAGTHYAASDVTALVGVLNSVSVLRDGDVVVLGEEITWLDATGAELPARPSVRQQWATEDVERGSYDDFMEKEIAEQPMVVGRLLEQLLPGVVDGGLWTELDLPLPQRLRFVACGSSFYASQVVARAFWQVAGIPAETVIASEFDELVAAGPADGVLTVAVSQSGETTDVLHALQRVPGPVLAITNRSQSSLARRSHAVLDISAGPEIGVAATKTFTTQVVAGAALALACALATGACSRQTVARQGLCLGRLPGRLEAAHALAFPAALALAEELAEARSFFFVSRGAGLPYAAEGALKLKEITYRNAESIPAGEFKHGPIALIEAGTPVLVLASGSSARLAGATAELASRGARIIRVGSGAADTFPVLPGEAPAWGPLESVLAFQHLARCIAVVLGRDADKPRNLAKSVTVL